jgi:hypothetical protein
LLFAQNKLTGYERWAQSARAQVEALRAARRVDQMRALNGGTRAAVSALQDRMVSLEQENRALRDTVATQLQTQTETNRLLTTIAGQLQSLTYNERRRQEPHLPRPPPPEEDEGDRRAEAAPGAAAAEEPPAAAAAEAAPAWGPAGGGPPRQQPGAPPAANQAVVPPFRAAVVAEALGALRATPRQPTVGTTCPSSWTTCLSQWRTLQLESFRDRPQTEWDMATRCRYNKRLLVMKQVERASDEQLLSLDDAATYLDRARADLSINFTAHLKSRSDSDARIPKRVAGQPQVRPRPRGRQQQYTRGRRTQQQQQHQQQQAPRRRVGGGPSIYNPPNSQGNRAMAEVRRSQATLQFHRLVARRNATLPQQFDILNDSEVEFGRRMREMQMDGLV